MSVLPKLAGLDPKPSHDRYVNRERVEVIARDLGVTAKTLRTFWRRHGLPTDLYAEAGKLKRVDLTDAHRRYMRGEPVDQLAEALGVMDAGLIRAFQRRGLPTFPRGKNPNSRNNPKGLNGRPSLLGRNKGDWRVEKPHQHVLADGVCLLCDLAVASA
jgi:hypothetical protein